MKNKNICWFARGGDLDFFAKISSKLQELDSSINSFYVCDTTKEKAKLERIYSGETAALNEYFKSYKLSNNEVDTLFEKFKNKYGIIPFRRMVWAEMYEKGYGDEFLKKYIVGLFNFWEKIITNNNIKYVVSEIPAILPNNVIWSICKKKEIKFIGFNLSPINNKSYVATNYIGNIGLEDIYKKIMIDKETATYKKATNYYYKMLSNPQKPSYYNTDPITGKILNVEKSDIFQKPPDLLSLLKGIKRKLIRNKELMNDEWYYKITGLDVFNSWFFARTRMSYFNRSKIFSSNVLARKEKYFLYTLNMMHEWMIYTFAGPHLAYPLDTIRFIASSLPLGTKLYVKEHTAYFPQRSISFYSELKKIPNVVLVDRREDTFELIKHSEGVVSIGGTPGWEAFVLGKTVIILNDTWYSNLPGMVKIDNAFDLVEYMNNYNKESGVTENEIIRAIYCLFNLGIEGALNPKPILLSDENIYSFANYLNKLLKNDY